SLAARVVYLAALGDRAVRHHPCITVCHLQATVHPDEPVSVASSRAGPDETLAHKFGPSGESFVRSPVATSDLRSRIAGAPPSAVVARAPAPGVVRCVASIDRAGTIFHIDSFPSRSRSGLFTAAPEHLHVRW